MLRHRKHSPQRIVRLTIIGLLWVAIMFVLWGWPMGRGARRSHSFPTYFGVRSALVRRTWIEGDSARPRRPIVWEVTGPLEAGPGFGGTTIITIAVTLTAVVGYVMPTPTNIVRKRRIARGLCWACGYDMRGSEGACPECGVGRPGTLPDG